jgi:hypothetical protein
MMSALKLKVPASSTAVTVATVLSLVLYTMYPSRLEVNEAVLSTSLFAVAPSVVPLWLGPPTLGMSTVSDLMTGMPVPT